jgi:hypothetical protein
MLSINIPAKLARQQHATTRKDLNSNMSTCNLICFVLCKLLRTQILAVLDNLEARLRSPHKGATTTSSSSRGAAAGSSSAAASSSNSSSSSSTPEPLDDPNPANHLAVNALTYASTIAAGLLKAHCRSPEDTAPLTREPFNGLRKALLPRLRQFLFTPHPQVVQAALQTAAVLTGMPMLPGFTQFELMIIFDRHPTRWVLARFLDSGVAVVTPQLCGLQDSLQEALKGVSNRGPEHTAITVDFDFPAISYNEVAVCDACGRHNYFPVLVRWAWKEPCQLKACSGCRQRRYWSAECQKVHWKAHKQRCKAMQAQRAAQKEK